jgi:cytochrome c oxidase subunit 2
VYRGFLRSRHALPLLIIALVVAGCILAIGFGLDWLPAQASVEAGRTDDLIWFIFLASGAIFTIVLSFLVYSIWRFRKAKDDDTDGPPMHGNTALEVIWTAIPALLLAALTVYSYVVLSDNEALAKDRLTVDVTGEQFAWSFVYPEQRVQTGDLRVPLGQQVHLRLHARDVIHDFFVSQFRLKADAVPGITNTLSFTANRVGTYPVVCAELCGLGHNTMRAQVIVMPKAEFQSWLSSAAATVKAS